LKSVCQVCFSPQVDPRGLWIASHVKSQDTFSVRTVYQIAESQLLVIHYTLYNIAVEHYYSRGGKKMLLFLTRPSSPTCFSTSIGYSYPLVFGFDVEVPILALACCSIVFTSNMSESDYHSTTGTNIRTANVIKEYGAAIRVLRIFYSSPTAER